MVAETVKKALVIPGLFFLGLFCQAQSVVITQPARGAALQDTQEFVVTVTGGLPSRMDFYLNGRLILARREAPWVFEVRWNTRYENEVRIVAHFEDDEPVVVTRSFEEIAVDIEEAVAVFQVFPFFEQPPEPGTWKIRAGGNPVTPQKMEPAGKLPLELIIALDTSGSMMFSFDQLEGPIRRLLAWSAERGHPTKLLIFDRKPSLIDLATFPPSLKQLYRERPSSVVWDTIATASTMFEASPRRVILVITDGSDQGSKHTPATARTYLRASNAALIWVSPTNLQSRELTKLCRDSGGFAAYTSGRDPWPGIFFLLDGQYHLLAPDATFPLDMKIDKGRVWYPRWEQ